MFPVLSHSCAFGWVLSNQVTVTVNCHSGCLDGSRICGFIDNAVSGLYLCVGSLRSMPLPDAMCRGRRLQNFAADLQTNDFQNFAAMGLLGSALLGPCSHNPVVRATVLI